MKILANGNPSLLILRFEILKMSSTLSGKPPTCEKEERKKHSQKSKAALTSHLLLFIFKILGNSNLSTFASKIPKSYKVLISPLLPLNLKPTKCKLSPFKNSHAIINQLFLKLVVIATFTLEPSPCCCQATIFRYKMLFPIPSIFKNISNQHTHTYIYIYIHTALKLQPAGLKHRRRPSTKVSSHSSYKRLS